MIYIRTTGLDGPVQLVRIKPSEFEKVATHLASRKDKPHQGYTARHRKEFIPLSERVGHYVPEDEDEEQPVVLVSPDTVFRERRRVVAIEPLNVPSVPSAPVRVRRREFPTETVPVPVRIRRRDFATA